MPHHETASRGRLKIMGALMVRINVCSRDRAGHNHLHFGIRVIKPLHLPVVLEDIQRSSLENDRGLEEHHGLVNPTVVAAHLERGLHHKTMAVGVGLTLKLARLGLVRSVQRDGALHCIRHFLGIDLTVLNTEPGPVWGGVSRGYSWSWWRW